LITFDIFLKKNAPNFILCGKFVINNESSLAGLDSIKIFLMFFFKVTGKYCLALFGKIRKYFRQRQQLMQFLQQLFKDLTVEITVILIISLIN